MTMIPRVRGARSGGRGDILLRRWLIPPDDVKALEGQGIGRLFWPGTPTSDLVEYIKTWAGQRDGLAT